METTKLNLCNILSEHIGEKFYSPFLGDVIFDSINEYNELIFITHNIIYPKLIVLPNGTTGSSDELAVYPSQTNKNWEKWYKNNTFCIRTWSDFVLNKQDEYMAVKVLGEYTNTTDHLFTENGLPIEHSACALMQINQLIDKVYGGVVSIDEMSDPDKSKDIYYILFDVYNKQFVVTSPSPMKFASHIAFHGKENALNFLTYNQDLLIKYYHIT